MLMKQLIPFDPSKGGKVPNLCLANVVKGYGIQNKYDSAWEAWEHTQQHEDHDIPANVAVPLFYFYTTTLDGITQNYGHINVQLPNGTVWSDGNIYANLNAYTAHHDPKFVGWGESVNDFKILEGGPMPTLVDDGNIDLLYVSVLHRHAAQADKDARRGQDYLKAQTELYESQEWANQDQLVKNPNPGYKSVGEAFIKA